MPTFDYPMTQRWSLQGQPIREQIMAALLTRAQTYLASASRDPIRRPEAALPRLIVLDAGEQKQAATYKKHSLLLTVKLIFIDRVDPQSDTISHTAGTHLAGLLAAFCSTDLTLGGLCDGLEYDGSTITYPEPGEQIVGVTLNFSIRYSVALGNPFSH